MAKVNKIIQSFNSGELSELMESRIDQNKYQSGCQTMENFLPLIYGGAKRRPGTEYIATQKAAAKGRMIAFERSIDNTYTLCFENQAIRVFKDGERVMNDTLTISGIDNTDDTELTVTTDLSHQLSAGDVVRFTDLGAMTELEFTGDASTEWTVLAIGSPTTFTLTGTDGGDFTDYGAAATDYVASIYEITSPYLTADIPDLKIEHSADVMYITHEDYEPRKLSRTGDTAWTLEVVDYRTGPFRDRNTDTDWTLTANDNLAVGDTVQLTSAKALFIDGLAAGHKASNITRLISALEDYDNDVADTTKVTTTTNHGYSTGDIVQITGTVSYNGQWNVTGIAATTFYIKTPHVLNDATGEVIEVTDKAHTGALIDVIQIQPGGSLDEELTNFYGEGAGSLDKGTSWDGPLTLKKGQKWDITTTGTWTGTLQIQRNETVGAAVGDAGWETVHSIVSADNRNVSTSGTEETTTADYQLMLTSSGDAGESCTFSFSTRSIENHGIVELTAYTSATVASGIVRTSLVSTTATATWAEGSWSNLRGWPKTVTMSPEDRLIYAGNSAEPLNVWGSEIGDWTNYLTGVLDTDPINFALVGSGQQNEIQWSVPKSSLVLGTVGGEHLLGASKDDEALTPTNVKAKLQTTYGSESIRAEIVNQAVIFVQRGGKKIRELLYDFESDSHKADDLTVFAEHITGTGIVDMAFQRTPDPLLWCVRADGEIAVMAYERDQDVYSWARIVTDGNFESVCVIYGGVREEDEVWVTVKRNIDDDDTYFVERFSDQKFTLIDEPLMVDCAVVVSSGNTAGEIVYASDTVRWDEGYYGSGHYGGTD